MAFLREGKYQFSPLSGRIMVFLAPFYGEVLPFFFFCFQRLLFFLPGVPVLGAPRSDWGYCRFHFVPR